MKSRNNIITLLAPIGLKHTQTPDQQIVCFEKVASDHFISAVIDHKNPQGSLIAITVSPGCVDKLEITLADIPKMHKLTHMKPKGMEFDAYMSAAATLANMYERLRGIAPFKGNMTHNA
ncbi:hypothetical protein LMH73_017070 [Vibrio splendidus]|nr:hypothetical protein [Vibrio splendidus]MCC4880543.1 hypothetical protein [Vibrio splendidus]